MHGDPIQRPLDITHRFDLDSGVEALDAQALRIAEAAMVTHWLAATSEHNLIATAFDSSVYTATRTTLRRVLSVLVGSVAQADEFYEWMLDGYCNEPIAYWLDRWAEHKRDVLVYDWDLTQADDEVVRLRDDDVIVHEPTPRGVDR